MLYIFVKNQGYLNRKLWSHAGWLWKKVNKIDLPKYWTIVTNENKKSDDKSLGLLDYNFLGKTINPNLPAQYMSYYEAEAIASFYNARLPTETEWEYAAGDEQDEYQINLFEDSQTSFNNNATEIYLSGINEFGICGMMGNVWEWCQLPVLPNNGYKNDPIWNDLDSYNLSLAVVRGGAWSQNIDFASKILRRFISPESRDIPTGIRLVAYNNS
jgi:formylglycine-generating enzyme required for sulfatase activity